MNELLKKISEGTNRLEVLNQEILDLEKSARDNEEQARMDRKTRDERKKERESLVAVLRNQQVQVVVENSQAAAQKAQQEAEQARAEAQNTLESVKKQQAELEELLARAKTEMPKQSADPLVREILARDRERLDDTFGVAPVNATLKELQDHDGGVQQHIFEVNQKMFDGGGRLTDLYVGADAFKTIIDALDGAGQVSDNNWISRKLPWVSIHLDPTLEPHRVKFVGKAN